MDKYRVCPEDGLTYGDSPVDEDMQAVADELNRLQEELAKAKAERKRLDNPLNLEGGDDGGARSRYEAAVKAFKAEWGAGVLRGAEMPSRNE